MDIYQIEWKNNVLSKFYVVKKITNYCPLGTTDKWNKLKGRLADENYNKNGKIHAQLGVGIWIKIIEPGIIKLKNALVVAHQTKLGYVILENNEDPYQLEKPYIGSIINKIYSIY